MINWSIDVNIDQWIDIIIDIVIEIAIDVGIAIAINNVIAFAIVIHIVLFEFFCKGEYFCNQVCNGGQLKPTQVFGKYW